MSVITVLLQVYSYSGCKNMCCKFGHLIVPLRLSYMSVYAVTDFFSASIVHFCLLGA